MSHRGWSLLVGAFAWVACSPEAGDAPARSLEATQAESCGLVTDCTKTKAELAQDRDLNAAWELSLMQQVLTEPALPGAPGFEKERAQIVARAKGEPVLFLRTPEATGAVSVAEKLALERYQNQRDRYAAVRRALKYHKADKATLRLLLLREGYLYSEDPAEAFALVSLVAPQHLFEENEIWIHRGEQLLRARKKEKHYEYLAGEHAGQRARLMHLDRVGVGAPPPALHRDLRALRYRLYFDQVQPVHLTERHLIVDLRYGAHWARAVLESEDARLTLAAYVVTKSERETLATAIEENRRKQAALQSLREAIAAQVAERLPFDEPRTEIGQEDGALRREWYWAYRAGQSQYEYNLDYYPVFTAQGQPRVPQVCIDFVVDSLERASGTWYSSRTASPTRKLGKLDLRGIEGLYLRRTDAFVSLAEQNSEWFETKVFSTAKSPIMGRKRQFFAMLQQQVDDFQPGDVVLIRGYTPWDEEKLHTHAFIIYESDPVTRMPILVAGNAGPANLWSWETEARRTPRRRVRYRIRPRSKWLQQVLLQPAAPEHVPSLLAAPARR